MRTVIGLFRDPDEARRSLEDLRKLGAEIDDLSVVSRDGTAVLGDARLSTVEVAGLGRVVASGPLATYLQQGVAGKHADDVVRALTRMGLPDVDARRYVDGVRAGYTLEAVVVPDDRAQAALLVMQEHAQPEVLERPEDPPFLDEEIAPVPLTEPSDASGRARR